MEYTFRNDQPDVAIDILRKVGQWLIDSGHELWAVDDLTHQNLVDQHTQDNLYVMYADDEPAAVFILQWSDPLYYPTVPLNTTGLIHKLAIRRQFAGQRLFTNIIQFCREQCLARHIHEIQLETDATRPKLLQFYESYGFSRTHRQQIEEFGKTFDCQYYRLRF
jgi:GNAT superfamily N-acetyltransferase